MTEPTHTDVDRTAPEAPGTVPTYVREGVERQDPGTLRELAAWADALADYRDQQPIETGENEELVAVEDDSNDGTKVVKKVPCGKDSCSQCPHGPYEYSVKRSGGDLVWEYVGPADE